MKITGNEITNDNMTPYTIALKKEEERRKLLLDQKKECMTQRAFKNYQSSLKNFDSTYNPTDISHLHSQSQGRETEMQMKNKKLSLL